MSADACALVLQILLGDFQALNDFRLCKIFSVGFAFAFSRPLHRHQPLEDLSLRRMGGKQVGEC